MPDQSELRRDVSEKLTDGYEKNRRATYPEIPGFTALQLPVDRFSRGIGGMQPGVLLELWHTRGRQCSCTNKNTL